MKIEVDLKEKKLKLKESISFDELSEYMKKHNFEDFQIVLSEPNLEIAFPQKRGKELLLDNNQTFNKFKTINIPPIDKFYYDSRGPQCESERIY